MNPVSAPVAAVASGVAVRLAFAALPGGGAVGGAGVLSHLLACAAFN